MSNSVSIFVLLLIANILASGSVFPNNKPDDELYQSCIDIKSGLNVLNISLKPGYEDFSALAYYRFGQGAKIMSAYITNGECTEADSSYYYPHQIAAKLKHESFTAISSLKGETYYLSFPEIISASNDEKIYSLWNEDSLKNRLYKLISTFKPDVILLSRDWYFESKNLSLNILVKTIKEVIIDVGDWKVSRFYYDDPSRKGIKIPVDTKDTRHKKSYRKIGEDAMKHYNSISLQLEKLKSRSVPSYSLIFPSKTKKLNNIIADLPSYDTNKLKNIKKDIDLLAVSVLKNQKYVKENNKNIDILKYLSKLSDSVNTQLSYRMNLSQAEYKIFLNWKINLDKIRNSLLGVKLYYTISETILTNRQLTILRVDSISGLSKNGTTELFFPGGDEDWVINESTEKRHPLMLGEEYRILSPANLVYSYPYEIYNLDKTYLKNQFYFFVIQSANVKEENFVYKQMIYFDYSPRFTVEILTPVVFASLANGDNEKFVFRLTNHTRDGIADYVTVSDAALVSSDTINVKLSYKGAEYLDTLNLFFKRGIQIGDNLLKLKIGEEPVANFVARRYDVSVDRTKKVGLISSQTNSITKLTLQRLNVKFIELKDMNLLQTYANKLDVIIIDRNINLTDNSKSFLNNIETFVAAGGKLIVLSQDKSFWDSSFLLRDIKLTRSFSFDEHSSVERDSNHRILNIPNKITDEDFENWIYTRTSNEVSITSTKEIEFPIISSINKTPLLVTKKYEKGTIMYVNMAIQYQLLNIQEGAYKLLANLISF
ncbi:MAG: hypothetical protein QME58_00205 [Bacteroidota bacterium]|nr:hypothetical protein [Bacteroidota bacterium]